MVTFTLPLPFIGISSVTYPIKEKTKVASRLGTETEYLPSKSVIVPPEESLTLTVTPIKGSPSAKTVPLTICCAYAPKGIQSNILNRVITTYLKFNMLFFIDYHLKSNIYLPVTLYSASFPGTSK